MPGEEPFHTISKAEVWETVQGIRSDVTSILEGQREQNGKLAEHGSRLNDHQVRIRSLDFKFYGVVAGLLGGLTYIVFGG